MKSRLAMTAMLVSGLLMSGTGATLAVSGTEPSTNASQEQYPTVVTPETTPAPESRTTPPAVAPAPPATGQVLPQQTSGGEVADETDDTTPSTAPESAPESSPDSAPEQGGTAPAGDDDVAPATREQGAQPAAQQAATNGESLPFTGFAAVPILLGGIALMAGGMVMRRRTAA